jgi:hypothetical protein
MGVSTDGLRSQRRVPFVTKVYRKINELNIPAKGGVFQGFVYKVINIGQDLWKGWIKAPMGVLVTRSTVDSIRQYTYDSIEVSPDRIFSSSNQNRFFLYPDPLPSGFEKVQVFFDGAATRNIIQTPVDSKPARPVTLCARGEQLLTLAAFRAINSRVHAATVHHCYSDGRDVSGTASITSYFLIGPSASLQYTMTLIRPPSMRNRYGYVLHKAGLLRYNTTTFRPIIWEYYEVQLSPKDAVSAVLHADILAETYGGSSQLSAKMRAAFSSGGQAAAANTGGMFGVVGETFCGISVTYTDLRKCTFAPGTCATFFADPVSNIVSDADLKFSVMLYYLPKNDATLLTTDQLAAPVGALLAGELSYYAPSGFNPLTFDPLNVQLDAFLLARTLGRLFGWPAEDEYSQGAGTDVLTPRDTVTFFDADGEVYSWLRCLDPDATQGYDYSGSPGAGAIKFDATSVFERVSVVMPAVVLDTVGVRPKILMMTDTTYYCVADNSSNIIFGLFVGSPFDEWVEIDLPEGATMHTIRCMQPGDSADSCGFIGIGRQELEDGIVYEFTYIKVAGKDWRRLAPIGQATAFPLTTESWDVCTFGDDAITQQMLSVQQVPTAVGARAPELR